MIFQYFSRAPRAKTLIFCDFYRAERCNFYLLRALRALCALCARSARKNVFFQRTPPRGKRAQKRNFHSISAPEMCYSPASSAQFGRINVFCFTKPSINHFLVRPARKNAMLQCAFVPRMCSLLIHPRALRARKHVFNAFFLRKECSSGCDNARPARKQSKGTFTLRRHAFSTMHPRFHTARTGYKYTRLQNCRSADVLRRQIGSHVVEYAFARLYDCVRHLMHFRASTLAEMHISVQK